MSSITRCRIKSEIFDIFAIFMTAAITTHVVENIRLFSGLDGLRLRKIRMHMHQRLMLMLLRMVLGMR